MMEYLPFPDKRYKIIYADPPWSYDDKMNAGKRGADFKYPTLALDDIMSMPVAGMAEQNCTLFMWITFPFMDQAIRVMNAWGFKYKTAAFVWVKTYPKKGSICMGCGSWTRANAELCLLGVRGKPKRIGKGVSQIIMSPRREHSRKPDEARERIVTLMGDLSRIELFARQAVPGWDGWGLEYPEGGEDYATHDTD